MAVLDWVVLAAYLAVVLAICLAVALRQKDQEDYFLAGRGMTPGKIGISMLATQVSTISLISGPTFVALRGGLKWLQYEFAVPLAMAAMILFLVPLFYRRPVTTIYEIMEQRFGTGTRLALTLAFMLSRGLATGAALYASSVVLMACLQIPLIWTILLMGLFTLFYTSVGGIKADIYSDIAQFVILIAGTVLAVIIGWGLIGGAQGFLSGVGALPLDIVDFGHHGLGDGQTFSFWPMFLGGLFLYVSYYGCDQSQAQRLLTAKNPSIPQKALLINGLGRFPLTLLYCFFGVILAVYLYQSPAQKDALTSGSIDSLVPSFILAHMPHGAIGLIMAAFFAAGMSSIDSALNSLSAATMKDFLEPALARRGKGNPRQTLLLSRVVTVLWGAFAIATAVWLSDSAKTVLEWVNMIGSVFYGPMLGIFALALFSRRTDQAPMLLSMAAGIASSLATWILLPDVSWMWWNLTGFAVTICGTTVGWRVCGAKVHGGPAAGHGPKASPVARRYAIILALYAALIVAGCLILQRLMS